MNYKQILRNVGYAFTAQGLSFFLSVIQSLLVPKLLGVEQYAYWQLFTFYSSYVGFFHLGLNDGVYLINGGKSRRDIDGRSVNSQFGVALVFQGLLSGLMLLAVVNSDFEGRRVFVIAFTAVYMVIQNAASYLMFVLQAMNETRLSSISTIVNRLSYLVPLVAFLLLGVRTFEPFILAYICSAGLQLLYCSWQCRDILASGANGVRDAVRESVASVLVGSKLMLANIASTLVLGVLRMVIDVAWGIETFGKLSFSLSLVSFFLAFVSQAAMVLFPALRQSGEAEVRSFYVFARDALGLVFPAIYLLYFPMVWLLGLWLPAYADSLRYFAWLIPICVFDSKMNITCTTLLKVRRKESTLLAVNVVTTLFCVVAVCASVFLVGSFELAIASATLCIIGRSIASERIVSEDLGVAVDDVSLWELALTCVFVALTTTVPAVLAMPAYAVLYLAFLSVHGKQLSHLLGLMRK